MVTKAIALVVFSMAVASGCIGGNAAQNLDPAIAQTKAAIAAAEAELANYGQGSLLSAVVLLRANTYKQTLAMLEQKQMAAWYYPSFSYTVDGRKYVRPPDADSRMETLTKSLETAKSDAALAKQKALGSGGMIGVLAQMESATKEMLVAQIHYQLVALQNDFPAFIASPSTGEQLSIPATNATATAPAAIPAAPTQRDLEKEAMQAAVSVQLISKKYVPQDWQKRRYDDTLELVLEYENLSEKEIRAFTGVVVFKDIFEREFLRVNLTVDEPIASGKKIRDTEKSLEINEHQDSNKKLVSTEMENLRVGFEVQSILFKDGTKLGQASE